MRKLLTYFLIFSYSLISINAFLPLVNFAINYKYVVEELCVERDLEVNTCNGNCQLQTQVSKNLETENTGKSQKPIVIEETETPLFSSEERPGDNNFNRSDKFCSIQLNILENYLDKITPPPKSFS